MGRIVVTGANRGIGAEFVRQYLEAGDEVVGTYRHDKGALADLESTFKGRLTSLQFDISEHDKYQEFVYAVGDAGVDLLINNAGMYPKGSLDEGAKAAESWLRGFAVNTVGPSLLASHFLPLVRHGEGKKIVVITSKMGSIADNTSGGSYLYRSTKAAVNASFRSLAVDLREEGISVGILHPGWVQTDMGGSNALITTQESVSGMRRVIEELSLPQSGKFFAFDGAEIPW